MPCYETLNGKLPMLRLAERLQVERGLVRAGADRELAYGVSLLADPDEYSILHEVQPRRHEPVFAVTPLSLTPQGEVACRTVIFGCEPAAVSHQPPHKADSLHHHGGDSRLFGVAVRRSFPSFGQIYADIADAQGAVLGGVVSLGVASGGPRDTYPFFATSFIEYLDEQPAPLAIDAARLVTKVTRGLSGSTSAMRQQCRATGAQYLDSAAATFRRAQFAVFANAAQNRSSGPLVVSRSLQLG